MREKDSNRLYNLNGKSVILSAIDGRKIYANFYGEEKSLIYGEEEYLIYKIDVERNGKTKLKSRERVDNSKSSKYYVIYGDGNREFTRTIHLRENREKYLSIDLYEEGIIFDQFCISFGTDMGKATVKLNKEEYDMLYEIML